MEEKKRVMPISDNRKEAAWWLALVNRIILCVAVFFCVIALCAAEDRLNASGAEGSGYVLLLLGAVIIVAEFWIALYAIRDILSQSSVHWVCSIVKLFAGISLYITMAVLAAASGAHLSAPMQTVCYALTFVGTAAFLALFSVLSYGIGDFCEVKYAQQKQCSACEMPLAAKVKTINKQTRTIPLVCALLIAGLLHLSRGIYSAVNRCIAHNDFMRYTFTGSEAVKQYRALNVWENAMGVILLILGVLLFTALILRVKDVEFGIWLEKAVRVILPILYSAHILKLISVYVTGLYFGAGTIYETAMKQVMTIYILGLIVMTVLLAFNAKRTWSKYTTQADCVPCAES